MKSDKAYPPLECIPLEYLDERGERVGRDGGAHRARLAEYDDNATVRILPMSQLSGSTSGNEIHVYLHTHTKSENLGEKRRLVFARGVYFFFFHVIPK